MSMFMRGISRGARPTARSQVAALRIADLRAVCRHLKGLEQDEASLRDRALLTLSALGLSTGAISRLDWQDVQVTPTGVHLRLVAARSGGQARVLTVDEAPSEARCSVDALKRWRVASGGSGPVFVGDRPTHGCGKTFIPQGGVSRPSLEALHHRRSPALAG